VGEARYQVRVIDRAIALLRCFSIEQSELSLTDLAEMADISRPTAHRLLSSLASYRLVQQDTDTKRYRLGLGVFELGNLVLAGLKPVEVAKPGLEQLVRRTGETAHMAVMDDGMATYVAKVEGSFSMRIASSVGLRLPCHCTGLGKALLAYDPNGLDRFYGKQPFLRRTTHTITDLEQLRDEIGLIMKRGFALDDEEFEDGLRCIAAPVFDHTGTAIAAISVSGPINRISDEIVGEWSKEVMNVAREISSALGHR
jgi:DNA-binding IclR family transcriptional regulator